MPSKWLLVISCSVLAACGGKEAIEVTEAKSHEKLQELRLEMLEQKVEQLEKSVKLTAEMKKFEEAKQKQAKADAERLERLTMDQRMIERNQDTLCTATGDC